MSSDDAIVVEGLCKSYTLYESGLDRLKHSLSRGPGRGRPQFQALQDVSFRVKRGETIGIVGRNGSGKSTLLQIIAGTLAPSAGEVIVRGEIAALLELGAGFHPELTGRENVFVNGMLVGLSRSQVRERLDAILDFAELGAYIDQPVKTYSSGMFVRLAFSLSVSLEPGILVVDEALAVGDEAFQRKCYARIEQIRSAGATILFVSHSAATVLELCDRALLLDHGERLLVGPPKTVVACYQRLSYAPTEALAEIREQTRQLDGKSFEEQLAMEPRPESPEAEPARPLESRLLEAEGYDPGLVPRSTLAYVPLKACIRDVQLTDPAGKPVNVLRRAGLYYCQYRVTFTETAHGVRFGMLIKNVLGVELGGVASHPPGEGLDTVEAGRSFRVRVPFHPRLVPGTYFSNVGIVGVVDGAEQFLHRIVDATMFRVVAESGLRVTVAADFTADRESIIQEDAQPSAAGEA